MATDVDQRKGLPARLVESFREIDPAGAYARYALYVMAIAGIAAACGYAAASTIGADAGHAQFAAVFPGILTGICLMTAQPGPSRRQIDRMLTIGAGVALGAGLGVVSAPHPFVAEPLTVVVAFTGFYIRRWAEPWPAAGFLFVLAFLINQILAPYAPGGVMALSIPGAVLGIALGFRFMPRAAFSAGAVAAVRRLRAEVPRLLSAHPGTAEETRASVRRVNTLIEQVNNARQQADRFNGAQADRHLALVHAAATVARVWDNAAESLHAMAGLSAHGAAEAAARAAQSAVETALLLPSPQAHGEAIAALDGLDRAVADTLPRSGSADPAQMRETAPFVFLNVELTLLHLIESVGELDDRLAAWAEARP